MKYPGQTTQSSILPKVLGAMPEHDFYIDGFAGTCEVFKNKRPTDSLLIDLNENVVNESLKGWKSRCSYKCLHRDTIDFLTSVDIDDYTAGRRTFAFLDPPWRHANRAVHNLYEHEMTDSDHSLLLDVVNSLDFYVAILHNRDSFYDKALSKWYVLDISASFRGKVTALGLYMNYNPEAVKRHNYNLSGKDRTDRQRMKRKAERWDASFRALPVYEQQIIFERIKRYL